MCIVQSHRPTIVNMVEYMKSTCNYNLGYKKIP